MNQFIETFSQQNRRTRATPLVEKAINDVPEFQAAFDTRSPEQWASVARTFMAYHKVASFIEGVDALNIAELNIARYILEKGNITDLEVENGIVTLTSSSFPYEPETLFANLLKCNSLNIVKHSLQELLRYYFSNPVLKNGFDNAIEMMALGSSVPPEDRGKIAKDGNSSSHKMYFGHTLGMQGSAMEFYAIPHIVSQIMLQYGIERQLPERVLEILACKDTGYEAFSTALRMLTARNQYLPNLLEKWNTSRPEGGVNWHAGKDCAKGVDPFQFAFDGAYETALYRFGPEYH